LFEQEVAVKVVPDYATTLVQKTTVVEK